MAWYPLATKLPIQPGSNDPPITAIGAILHVDSGNSTNLFNYFNGPSKGIESHFLIPKDGPIQQYRDTAYEADANLKANSFLANGKRVGFVSIETQGFDKGEWTDYQLQQIKTLLKWLSETHSFPLSVCTSSTSPGVGYHTMWGAPGPWTPVAKDCPGPDRVRQFHNVLTPWFEAGAPMGGATVGTGADDMSEAQYNNLMAAIKSVADDVRSYALWEVLYGLETEDERAQAQKAYSDAIGAGKSPVEARAAASAAVQSLVDAVKESQKKVTGK